MMKPIPPCEGRISNPFAAVVYGTDGKPIYTNAWKYHLGLDIAVDVGTPVLAAGSGVVEAIGRDDTLGGYVVLGHPGGLRTFYAHLSKIAVNRLQSVEIGEWVGLSGNTGMSTGPHLHFECWVHCTGLGDTPYTLTRDDPDALPADPVCIWQGRWPTAKEGQHTASWAG